MDVRAYSLLILATVVTPAYGQDTTKTAPPPIPARSATNPRLLPDVSMVGDLIGDFSRRGSTQEGGQRFAVREVELAIQSAIDPYFRGDVFLGLNDEEKISIEQAYLTATALPGGLEARFGRFLMPFGKQNMTHRHDLHTIEYPWVLQRFLGPEGLKGTGIYLSKVFSPLGFYQELQVTATDRFGEFDESLQTTEPVNTKLANLGFSARLRNYVDLTNHANLEISASAITGKRPGEAVGVPGVNAVTARQSLIGIDATYRWRPLKQGLYRSFILQAEILRQLNGGGDIPAGLPAARYLGPTANSTGGYVYSRYQLTRRTFLGARYDWVADPDAAGERLRAASGYWQFFPSEFSKILIGYERVTPPGESAYGRIMVQATFAMGPHKPHPF
ncbi:MAG: hypothetical protein EXR94_10580 [Gemmatimonadetes bacterium]|nr:hypothetical protein [Gemmatimonadota bacterium]